MPIKEKKNVFKVKDISNDGVIKKVKDFSKPIEIKTETEKYAQNKNIIKTSDIKEKSYKEQVIDEKKEVVKNIETPIYDNKNDIRHNHKEENKKNKSLNNRYSLSKRVLRNTEYTLDQILNGDNEDLGIDTIIKSKAGVKATATLTKKNIDVSKRVGKKVYKVATSENAKLFYAGTINMSKKAYERTRDMSTKIYVKKKVNAYLKSNSLKERQKREIKKKMSKKAKEKLENTTYLLASKLKDILTSIVTNKVVIITLIIIALIVTLISVIVGIMSVFAYSAKLSLDDNLTMITEYISELDYNINSQIDKAPENYPYIDNFVYNVPQRAETNEEQIYAYLNAKYGKENISETVIKSEIEQIHNNLYNLSFSEKTDTWTEQKDDGTTESKSTITMTITLISKSFADFYEENKDILLGKKEQKDYEDILKLMKENVGKKLNNPFPKVDWRKYITSEYGYRTNPITGEYSKHTGLDIGMAEGTQIHSCMSGSVQTFNSGNSGFGLHLTVTHGKYKTLYAHCSEILVQDGQKINAGDVIAKVGNTGNSTGPHLHLEYFVNGERKNPKIYLKIYEE